MKKILHIQVLPIFSGVQRISYDILKSLPSSDYEKTIMFSLQGTNEQRVIIKNYFNNIGVKVVFSKYLVREINLKKDWYAFFEIYSFCKKEHFDIVHTNSTKPGIIGRLAATFAKVPLVIHTVHGIAFNKFISFPKRQFYWLCEIFASCFCHRIVLVNDYYKKYFKIFKHKLTKIYNGVDYAKFSSIKEVAHDDGKIRVLFVGRLDLQKNPLSLLKTAKIILEKRKDVLFTLVGDGEFYGACKNYIEENNLIENVTLSGWSSEPEKFYSESDIFMASSIYESFGLMFLEAGFFSLPSCATNVEGIPEVISDGITGLLCNPNDEESMANNILKLCNDKELRVKMGKAAKKRSEEFFNIENMTNAYKQIYEIK